MREILFRAKRIDNGEWVEGYYIKAKYHWHEYGIHEDWIVLHAIQNGGFCNVTGRVAVDPETVSQFTGLCDKNGKKIFENDIIRVCTNGFDREVFETKVLFGVRSGVQGFYLENGRMMFYWGQTDLTKMDDAEVIGNSFDNQKE